MPEYTFTTFGQPILYMVVRNGKNKCLLQKVYLVTMHAERRRHPRTYNVHRNTLLILMSFKFKFLNVRFYK